jgi:hypothetical protein
VGGNFEVEEARADDLERRVADDEPEPEPEDDDDDDDEDDRDEVPAEDEDPVPVEVSSEEAPEVSPVSVAVPAVLVPSSPPLLPRQLRGPATVDAVLVLRVDALDDDRWDDPLPRRLLELFDFDFELRFDEREADEREAEDLEAIEDADADAAAAARDADRLLLRPPSSR